MSTKTTTITKSKSRVFRLKKTPDENMNNSKTKYKPYKRTRYNFSWKGLEHKREELHTLARQIVQKDAQLKKVATQNGFSSIGAVMSAIRDPSTACSPYVL